jgi:hypothetical protein
MEDGEEKERQKKKKNIAMGDEGFTRPGPTLLSVQRVAAVRCN